MENTKVKELVDGIVKLTSQEDVGILHFYPKDFGIQNINFVRVHQKEICDELRRRKEFASVKYDDFFECFTVEYKNVI